MPTITQLTYAVAVSRHKHFGRAAQECHVSQPSLSAQIQKLEDEMGFEVFDRSKQPILITQRGVEFLEQARSTLREHQKLYEIGKGPEEVSGPFHLGVIPSLSSYVVPLFVEKLASAYPALDLTISELKTEEIILELNEDRLDAGILVTPLHEPGLFEVPLFYEPFYAYVSKDHELMNQGEVTAQDLKGFPIWLLDEGHCFRDQVIRVCRTKNRNEVLKNVHFASGHLQTLINLIRKGRGYTLLPHLATLDLSAQERREQLKPFGGEIPTREVSLVRGRKVAKQAVARALKAIIVDALPRALKEAPAAKSVIDI